MTGMCARVVFSKSVNNVMLEQVATPEMSAVYEWEDICLTIHQYCGRCQREMFLPYIISYLDYKEQCCKLATQSSSREE
jgi:hypothetical protein